MPYTIDYCDNHLDSLTDKLGSDYFPLPVKMGRFVTMTYDFLRENAEWFEANQEVSDDIKPLVVRMEVNSVAVPNSNLNLFEVAEPANYFRLLSLVPLIVNGNSPIQRAKTIKIIREGQRDAYIRDPFRRPIPSEPHITRRSNFFEINVGPNSDNYTKAMLSYIKKPTFGNINNLNEIIVNLPDLAIEKIMLKTAASLRFTTSDESANDIYLFDRTFGKRSK